MAIESEQDRGAKSDQRRTTVRESLACGGSTFDDW
ncbi:uncharacterized protein G2W53_001257 [Senna tora]|uniref:Uncharacterized protein n=1 Tax=Senna tora TaxID=362788 RepID=A0A835CME9_9FABA|nr:uncharacterized protein G2W53_001257 [Senna tora]